MVGKATGRDDKGVGEVIGDGGGEIGPNVASGIEVMSFELKKDFMCG